jgi:hypothetical protein
MGGSGRWGRWRFSSLILGGTLAMTALAGQGQDLGQHVAKPEVNVEDKDDVRNPDGKVWVLDFKFNAPRLITVDVPGRGRRLCWYLKYQVINNTHKPHTFYPDFELVTLDKPGVYPDQVLPEVQEAIRLIEDPTGYQHLKNSVTISDQPIPPSKPLAKPTVVNGVAIWDNVEPEANRFSIFVSGLSNGWSLAEVPPDNKQIIRRKTLQLNFKRLGDRYTQRTGDIQFVSPAEWVYRATGVNVTTGNTQPRQDKPADAGSLGFRTRSFPERYNPQR